jgi:hypothetical protein
MHKMTERPPIERVGPIGEDNGLTPKPTRKLGNTG